MEKMDIKKLVMDLNLAKFSGDDENIEVIKYKLYNNIRSYSAMLKMYLNEELEEIKSIFISNLKSDKFKFHMTVEDNDEAIGLLKSINLTELLELNVNVGKDFDFVMAADIVKEEHTIIDRDVIEQIQKQITDDKGIIIEDKIESLNDIREVYKIKYLKLFGRAYINNINADGEVDYRIILKDINIKLNIIEIYKILFNVSFNGALKALCDFCGICIRSSNFEFRDEQEDKYKHNIEVLNNINNSYPVLVAYIKKDSIEMLKDINQFSINNFMDKEFSVDNESILFFSNKFIANIMDREKPYDQSVIGIKINLMCALGLLRKLRTEELPKKGKIYTIHGKHVNYYLIPKYTDTVLFEAEKRVNKLLKKGITASMFDGAICRNVFGEAMYLDIYGNTKHLVEKANAKREMKEKDAS